ncbi:hypothetical protein LSM04_009089 [Trypanosoma melophagium]|uniref:uncharacterized protein n=1 Tax=Trypanosoma melophagium TaxID=715481 RepID=UPI00351AAB8F|nr:hypothetical protein LSM04_009089 [Trypanosoma melophagium]
MERRPQLEQCSNRCICGCGCCRLLREAHALREQQREKSMESLRRGFRKWHPLDVPKMGKMAKHFMNEEQYNVSDPQISLRMRFMY